MLQDMQRQRLAAVGRYYNKQGGVSNVMAQLVTRAQTEYDTTVVANEFLDWDLDAAKLMCGMLRRPRSLQTPTFGASVARSLKRRDFDLIHCHDAQAIGADIYTAHSCFPAYISTRRQSARRAASFLSRVYPPHVIPTVMSRLAFSIGDPVIVSVSGSVRDELINSMGIPAERVRVIHNGVDLDRFNRAHYPNAVQELERRIGQSLDGTVRLAFVGYEFERKRLDVAIRALAACNTPRPHLFVAGKAASMPYEQLAAELGIRDRVHFLGHCPDVERILSACHIFVFPTRYEAASLAILEAAACELAIITTDVAMAGEVFVDHRSAMLLPNTDDPAAAAAALTQLIENPQFRRTLAAAALKTAIGLGWNQAWAKYREMYHELLALRSKRSSR